MIDALLLDLDGTLLDNDIDAFLQAYLKTLSRHMASWVPPERLVPQLLYSTNAMLANQDPARTLRQAFAADFYPALGTTEEALAGRFEEFYRDEFPKLVSLSRMRDSASRLVQAALGAGMRVAVATNPLFPRMAIDHRLEWAGVPSNRYAFEVVTSYETSHSAKPQLAYFAEILGHLGVEPARAAMVGDNPSDDLAPARALGMAVYHVGETPVSGYPGGTLEKVWEWVASADRETDPQASRRPAGIVARLHGHLGTLLTRIDGLSEEEWHAPMSPEGWTPTQVSCLLRDLEAEVHLPCLEAVLVSDNPFLPAVDSSHWVAERGYASQSGTGAVRAFVDLRKETLGRLRQLTDMQWSRTAIRTRSGTATLSDIMALVADHELVHLAGLRPTRQ